MNLTPVEFHFVAPNGDPIADADVEIQLSKAGFDDEVDGVIMPRGLIVRTDTDGRVTVSLQPSPIHYVVTVLDPETEAGLFYKFYVPVMEGDTPVRLQDIIVDAPMSGATYDEAALVLISATKANVLAAQAIVTAAKVASQSAQAGAETARDTALRTLQVNSLTPPENPFDGMEWYNPSTGRKYTWIVQDNGHATWAEIGALLVISTPAPGDDGTPFNPGNLDEIHTLPLASASLLLEQNGEGLRIPLEDAGIKSTDLPAGIPTKTSVIVFTQGGADMQCTVAQLASIVDQINRGLI